MLGCGAGKLVDPRLEEAIMMMFLEERNSDTIKEWLNSGTLAVPRLCVYIGRKSLSRDKYIKIK
jgi:hypothetical protein